jgi:hypothetical protein
MLAKTTVLCLALGLLAPALAQADIFNSQSLKGKQGKALRTIIAAKLNQMPAADTGRGTGKFYQSHIKGTYSTHVGFAGMSYGVNFTAVPRIKVCSLANPNVKPIIISVGGCAGSCNITRFPSGTYTSPVLNITSVNPLPEFCGTGPGPSL